MKEGTKHWWRERVTAALLLPLTLWFLTSIAAHSTSDHAAFVDWLKRPISASLMVALLLILFYHAALGVQIIIEDYVHSANKDRALIMMRLGFLILAAAGILAVVLIALSS